jgi:hypothetical protein
MERIELLVRSCLLVLCIWPGAAGAVEPVTDLQDNSGDYTGGSVPKYRKFEVSFKLLATCGNPFLPYPSNPAADPKEQADAQGAKADPNGATVTGVFNGPGGVTLRAPAFWDGEGLWRLRMCPTKIGQWSYLIEVTDARGASKTEPRTFGAVESNDPGFVRVSGKCPRFFQFEGGATFIPLGNNLPKTTDGQVVRAWAQRLRQHNMNSQRVWLHPYATALEWTPDGPAGKSLVPETQGLGRYCLTTAKAMDAVVDQAEENGLYLLVCQDDMACYRGAPQQDPKVGWEYNPYKAVCKDGAEFFTSDLAKRNYKARLRYMVARWGWSPHVFGWELMNEMDSPYLGNVPPDQVKRWRLTDLVAWSNEMAEHLRTVDPYRRPVSISTGSNMLGWGKPPKSGPYDDRFFLLHQKMDFSNHHVYQSIDANNAGYLQAAVQAFGKGAGGKPLVVGEWGLNPQFEQAEKDIKEPVGLHNAVWTGVMAAGAAPYHSFPNKYVEIGGLRHYQLVAKFLEGEDPLRDGMDVWVCDTGESKDLRAYAMIGKRRALVWAWDLRSVQGSAPPKSGGGKVRLSGLSTGQYKVEFFDPWTMNAIATKYITAGGDRTAIILPGFTRDVAAKVSPSP